MKCEQPVACACSFPSFVTHLAGWHGDQRHPPAPGQSSLPRARRRGTIREWPAPRWAGSVWTSPSEPEHTCSLLSPELRDKDACAGHRGYQTHRGRTLVPCPLALGQAGALVGTLTDCMGAEGWGRDICRPNSIQGDQHTWPAIWNILITAIKQRY